MQFDRRETILLFALCFAIVLAVLFMPHDQPMYAVPGESSPGQGQQHIEAIPHIQDPGILFRTWWNPEAFWGAVMSVLTVFGFALLTWQLIETRKATRETRRSVDAYVDVERGKMAYHRMKFDGTQTEIKCAIKNIGRGPVTVNGISFGSFVVPNEAAIPREDDKLDERSKYCSPLESLGIMSSGNFIPNSAYPIEGNIPIDATDLEAFKLGAILVGVVRVEYSTAPGVAYVMRGVAVYDPTGKKFRLRNDADLTYDLPVDKIPVFAPRNARNRP